ncbi:MAG: hypothetical protein OIN66_10250 [Candidatus Methanoperedens sp.]|nr:hypothetical protein [Candidatus Methanoperedens sp.]
MKKIAAFLIMSAILISGCVSTINPVSPDDVIVSVAPVTVKEFKETDLSVRVSNNATEAIDSVKVASMEPFSVLSGGNVNVPPKTKDGTSSVTLSAKVQAPGFKTAGNTTTMTLSYTSGKDDKGAPVVKTKAIPVQTTVLPDAKLQFVGFVKGIQNITEAEVTTWTIGKGENATITLSVKNEGQTTIDENSLKVFIDVAEKRIGTNKTITITEAMARGGTSYTRGVELPIRKDAPNGETDVNVKLLDNEGHELDSKTLTLKVKL